MMFRRQKLFLGKMYAAWSAYPATRFRLASIKKGSPILVTGTHRSGTTWAGNMLAASGIWHSHEPFAPYKGLWNEWFTYAPRTADRADIDGLMSEVLAGKHRHILDMDWVEHPLMPLRLLPQPVHRVLIKDPIACLMSEYLTNTFDMQTLVLFRHPAAFVESVTRLDWPQQGGIASFLANPELMDDFLHPYSALMESVVNESGVRTAAVMHGCLCTVLWGGVVRNDSMQICLFEQMCEDPIDRFKTVFEQMQLPYDDTIRQKHIQMCYSDCHEDLTTPHAVKRTSSKMASGWKKRLASDDISVIRRVWESFDVPLYQQGLDWDIQE